MLTYGPSSNTFMGQIGSFIDMYIRWTVLNGFNPIKSSLNRGNIFLLKIYDRNVELAWGVETIESPNYGV